jgi:hypothetical protein
MRALFTADLHLTMNPRDQYRLDWFERLPDLARRLKCTTAIIGGDFTEMKDRHGAWLTNFIAEGVHRLSKVCPVIAYKGNHDYLAEDQPFFAFLGLMQDVTWYSAPASTDIGGIGKCAFLPHTRNYQRDWSELMPVKGFKYVFAHNTFKGAVSESGKELDGIPLDVFGRGQTVISGDVHKPQSLGLLRYVGAPYTIDFGDDYRPRVFTITHDTVTSVWQEGPKKVLIDVTMSDTMDILDRTETIKGDVVLIRVAVTRFEKEAWSKVVDVCRSWAELRSVQLHAVRPIVTDGTHGRVMRKPSVRRSDEDILDAFGKHRQIDTRTMKTGRFIMERAK